MLDAEDTLALLRKMRMNLTQLQGQLTDVIEAVASLPLDAKADRTCTTCGVVTRGPSSLAEHIHTSHDGPVPEAWLEAERLAGLET